VSPRKVWARIESGNLDVRFDDLLRLSYAFGFELARVRGSHHILLHSERQIMLNLQPADGKAKRYQIRQIEAAVREHGLRLRP
jgi:predicted RNA binding protein YcfA (HicA-like mRNA interferase family)